MTVGRQTNAGGGLMRAEFPKKLPDVLDLELGRQHSLL
jgi:hypothetical protein